MQDCLKKILESGELMLTAAQRKAQVDKKRNEMGNGVFSISD